MLACAQKNTGAAQYSGVDIQRGEAALPRQCEKITSITGSNNGRLSRSVQYRPTLDCQALSIIALTSKFQRSSVTLLT